MGMNSEGRFAIFGYLWCVYTVVHAWALYEQHYAKRSGPRRIVGLLLISTMCRTTWYFLRQSEALYDNDDDDRDTQHRTALFYSGRLTNRLALLVQLSGISLLVLVWARRLHSAATHVLQQRVHLACNVAMYLVVIPTALVEHTVNLFAVSIVTMVLVGAVMVYSFILQRRMQTSELTAQEHQALKKLRNVSTCICIFYILRAVLFSYEPIAGDRLASDNDAGDRAIYPFLFYGLPDFAVSIVVLHAIAPRHSIFRTISDAFQCGEAEGEGDAEESFNQANMAYSISNPARSLSMSESVDIT